MSETVLDVCACLMLLAAALFLGAVTIMVVKQTFDDFRK